MVKINNENMCIYLTNILGRNSINIKMQDNFKSKENTEIFKIIAEELLFDGSGKLDKWCTIDSIIYELKCTDLSKYRHSPKRYKCLPNDIGFTNGEICESKVQKQHLYDFGTVASSVHYLTSKYKESKSLLDCVKTHTLSYCTAREKNSPLNSQLFDKKTTVNVVEIVELFKDRTYSAFKSNLTDEYVTVLGLNN